MGVPPDFRWGVAPRWNSRLPSDSPTALNERVQGTPLGADFDRSLLRRALIALVAAKIVALIVVFDPGGLDAFHLPKSLVSRGVAWLLAALVLLALYRYGRRIVPPSPLHVLVAAFVAAYVASAGAAENAYLALFGDREKYLGMSFAVDMFVLYWAVAISFRRARDWAAPVAAAGIAGALAVGYAAAQSLGLDPISWDMHGDRPFGTFGNPDMLGHFLSLAFGAAVGIALFGSPAALPRGAAVCAVAVALMAAAVIATRGSFIGFLTALGAVPFVYLRLRGASREAFGRIAVGAVAAAAVLSGVVALSPIADRARVTMQGAHVRDRALLYEAALHALAERPLVGYGPDAFALAHARYRQEGSVTVLFIGPAVSAHSWPLQTAATLGATGLLAQLALVAGFAWSLWTRGIVRVPQIAVPLLLASAAYWGHGLVAVDAVSVDWFPWVAFAGAAALEAERRAVVRARARLHPAAVAVVLAAAALAASSGSAAFRSNHHALDARFAWQEARADDAVAAAVASVREDAGRADHWNWLGLALELRGGWHAAADAYAEAARRAPHEAAYWSNLARSRARQVLAGDESGGGGPAALAAATRAVEADRNAPEPNAVLAEIANLLGEPDVALEAAVRAIRLFPREPNYDALAALAARNSGDQAAARQALEAILALRDSLTLRLALAEVSFRMNDRDAARLHAARALELDPQSIEARAILASVE